MVASASTFVDMGGLDLIVRSITLTGTPFTGVGNTAGTTGLLYESVQDGIVAKAGGGQATATQLTAEVNRVITVATLNDSVALPAALPGLTIFVVNHGANAMQVFGNNAAGDLIDDIVTGTGVSQMAGSMCIYTCTIAGKWYSEGLATGYATAFGLQTLSNTNNITAHAGGGQGAATPLTTMMNRITTVATAADSVLLPVSTPGMNIFVANAAANSCNVFPAGTDSINALGASAAFALAGTNKATFFCTNAGQWHTISSA